MEDSVEVLLEKFIHLVDDPVAKVSNEAEQCLSIVLSEYDQYKSLSVIVPLLITEDGKTLVTCIKCLTKANGGISKATDALSGELWDVKRERGYVDLQCIENCLVGICAL
ncbi:hypothetical protein ACFE04_021845 [Oxalis oulophora]